ncbi:SMI1/KNR4 family protein [Actinokineospora terrae]|uniref:SMI1/KNR4 family protein n=1 Tax=Actinokineospora terrae TaxID=155974 RepID=UPI0011607166|nr:SMI1/KNR4 family protein [Actinokineospora terrae]
MSGQFIEPASVVWDPDYRYRNHPLPGMPRPAAAEPTGRPTDPELLAAISGLVDEFTTQYLRIKGRPPRFGERATEAGLAAAETRIGARLPEDIRALYQVAGTDPNEIGLLGRWSLTCLDSNAEEYGYDPIGVGGHEDGVFDSDRVVLEAEPARHVRRLSRSDWWIVIGSDYSGGNLVVDLDPGPRGNPGQLLEEGRGIDHVQYVAESATSVLTAVVAAARENRIEPRAADGDWLGAIIDEPHTSYQRSQVVGDRDLADVLAEYPDPTLVQELYLHKATTLDLTALAATPRLRSLLISRADLVRLWLPPLVEGLTLTAGEADLSALAGHPALWDLTITRAPVRAADLTAIPALTRLDLSGTEVDDITAVADLDLRVLILNPAQWERLRLAGRLPTRLVAARLSGKPTTGEAHAWATWLRETHHDPNTAP